MSEVTTQGRFLGAIAAQLPAERVVEVHLFGAIRQGGMESGVAVIAVDPHDALPLETLLDEASLIDAAAVDAAPAEPRDAPSGPLEVVASVEAVLQEPVVRADGEVVEPPADDDSPYADAGRPADEDSDAVEDAPPPRPAPRFTVYSARYRHTLKGPDRGRWEVAVTEEADAPLLTVDAVVRGVSRRSGEADETVRLSGDEFRAAIPTPAPLPAAPARPARTRA